MSSYYPRFKYLGINSQDKKLVVANLDGGDSGEMDTFLGMEPIYTDNASGTQRLDYGAKFNNVAVIKISTIKQDGSDFSVDDTRNCLKWLTGSRTTSPLDLINYVNEEFAEGNEERTLTEDGKVECKLANKAEDVFCVYIDQTELPEENWTYNEDDQTIVVDADLNDGDSIIVNYSKIMFTFIGRVTSAWHYKMDARTVGITFEFTSISPWAYSPVKTVERKEIDGTVNIPLPNESDDIDTPIYVKTTFTNSSTNSNGSLTLINTLSQEETEVSGLAANETIIMDSNQMIISEDNPTRIFGSSFNFVFPSLRRSNRAVLSEDNIFSVTGKGDIKFEYIVPIKAGDCVMNVMSMTDPICDDEGNIQIDTLDWSRISGKPNNLAGYGLSEEVTGIINSAISTNVYTKFEINKMLENFVDDDVYTKEEINTLLSSTEVKIDEDELNTMLEEVLV